MKITSKQMIALSLLPLIFVANSLENALIAGLVLFVITTIIKFASIGINKLIEGRLKTYTYMILTASLITVISIVLGTYFQTFELVLIYASLILLNLDMVYENNEVTPVKQLVISSITLAMIVLLGLLREVLGTGTITLALLNMDTIELFASQHAISFLTKNSGGFILAGFIIAVMSAIEFKKEVAKDAI